MPPHLRALLAAAAIGACSAVTASPTQMRMWPVRAATPALELVTLDGQAFDAGTLRGKVVILNFWASWCGPCVTELPVLNDMASNSGTDVAVLAVNYKESPAAIERFAAQHGLRIPILRDKSGATFKAWTEGVMPSTILIDRTGRACWRFVGDLNDTEHNFREALSALLKQQVAP